MRELDDACGGSLLVGVVVPDIKDMKFLALTFK